MIKYVCRAFLLMCTLVTGFSYKTATADAGENFGATLLGSAVGTTIGTVVGNAISAPKPCREARETIVKEVYVPSEMPARRRKLESLENKYRCELDDLYGKKDAIERRMLNLESELSDVEAAIETHEDALRRIECKKRQRLHERCD